jgi:hypothetical protein
MPINQTKLAHELGISKSLLTKYKHDGAPIDQGADAVRRWRGENIQDRITNLGSNFEGEEALDLADLEIDLLLTYPLPEGEEPEDALYRLRLTERRLFAEIESIENHLKTHKNIKLARQLPTLRRQWLETSKAATAVWRVLKSMDAGNELKNSLDAADKYITLILGSVFYWVRAFPGQIRASNDLTGVELRELALKKTRQIIENANNLIPNAFAKSGLEDLRQRAFDIVEAAKAKALAEKAEVSKV